MGLGYGTTREAISLAAFVATLLAPFLTGIVLELAWGGDMWAFSGFLALGGALSLMPVTMLCTWVALRLAGSFACRCAPWSLPVLVICTIGIGICVALVGVGPMPRLHRPEGWLILAAFVVAGALSGIIYAALIAFWDALLKSLCEKTNGRLDGRPFARNVDRLEA